MVYLKSSKGSKQKLKKRGNEKMKKIRMVQFNNGEIVAKKYVDLENKVIKERNEKTQAVVEFSFENIVKAFGSIEAYIEYNVRVWDFSLLDNIH
jgi:hypothetical protein